MPTYVHVRVENRLMTSDRIRNAAVSIDDTPIAGNTNAYGVVRLDTTGLADGTHTLRVTAPHTTTDVAGPAMTWAGAVPERVFRSLEVAITTRRGRVTGATIAAGNTRNGSVTLAGSPRVIIRLQPVWMRTPNNRPRGGVGIDLIVVHHTGGPQIGPALNWFMNSSSNATAHYLIDTDGQVVKLVQENLAAFHVGGASYWTGRTNVTGNSIGIEVVHRSGPYPEAQYGSLLDLLESLLRAYPTIARHRIVGHSDVATAAGGRGVLGRKSGDPGTTFQWSRLEARNMSLGIHQMAGPPAPDLYGGFFQVVPGGAFRSGDNDGTRRFGGARRPAVTGNPVEAIQRDLHAIGYSVGTPNGDYGARTEAAVRMLQEHFHERGLLRSGRVDQRTAQLIWALA